jgi:hypothetical protein
MAMLARFSAFALIIVPAIVTGADPPERDMVIDATGTPHLESSAMPSTASSSNERGAIEQQMTENKGLFFSSFSPPAMNAPSFACLRESSMLETSTL